MKDIYIGDMKTWGNSWICNHDYGFFSENDVSYSVGLDELEVKLMISKASPEGQKLQALIEKEASTKLVREFCQTLVIRRLTPVELLELLANSYRRGKQNGRKTLRSELRNLLEGDDA